MHRSAEQQVAASPLPQQMVKASHGQLLPQQTPEVSVQHFSELPLPQIVPL
jgi:hypothetical protein